MRTVSQSFNDVLTLPLITVNLIRNSVQDSSVMACDPVLSGE